MNLVVYAKKNLEELEILNELPDSVRKKIVFEVDDLAEAAKGADVFFICNYETNKEALIKVLEVNPDIKWVHTWWTGVDSLLFPGIEDYKFTLTNSRGLYAKPLAEFAIFSCLYFAKDFPRLQKNKTNKCWQQFGNELVEGKTIGIFGYGEIGKSIALKAKALGMKVIASRKRVEKSDRDPSVDLIVPFEDCETIFKEADYIVNAAPLTSETRGFIDYRILSLMKKTAAFINVGRGAVVNENDLILALKNKLIAGAALDVFEKEPLSETSDLWDLDNVIVSPHSTDQNRGWLEGPIRFFVENCGRFLREKPLEYVVDKNLGY